MSHAGPTRTQVGVHIGGEQPHRSLVRLYMQPAHLQQQQQGTCSHDCHGCGGLPPRLGLGALLLHDVPELSTPVTLQQLGWDSLDQLLREEMVWGRLLQVVDCDQCAPKADGTQR